MQLTHNFFSQNLVIHKLGIPSHTWKVDVKCIHVRSEEQGVRENIKDEVSEQARIGLLQNEELHDWYRPPRAAKFMKLHWAGYVAGETRNKWSEIFWRRNLLENVQLEDQEGYVCIILGKEAVYSTFGFCYQRLVQLVNLNTTTSFMDISHHMRKGSGAHPRLRDSCPVGTKDLNSYRGPLYVFMALSLSTYAGVSKSFRTESITK
jgi:hypothetical protein